MNLENWTDESLKDWGGNSYDNWYAAFSLCKKASLKALENAHACLDSRHTNFVGFTKECKFESGDNLVRYPGPPFWRSSTAGFLFVLSDYRESKTLNPRTRTVELAHTLSSVGRLASLLGASSIEYQIAWDGLNGRYLFDEHQKPDFRRDVCQKPKVKPGPPPRRYCSPNAR